MIHIEIDLTEADFVFDPDRDFAGLLQVMQSRAQSLGESRFGEVKLSRTGERLGSIVVLRTCAEYDAEDESRSDAEIEAICGGFLQPPEKREEWVWSNSRRGWAAAQRELSTLGLGEQLELPPRGYGQLYLRFQRFTDYVR